MGMVGARPCRYRVRHSWPWGGYMITVYGAPPTRALRVLWRLTEMGLDYGIHPVDFASRLDDAEFIAASSTAAVPAFRHGDVRLMESCAILEYLGAKYGPTPPTPS